MMSYKGANGMKGKSLAIQGVALLLLALFSAPGTAKEALKEDFGKIDGGAGHKGPAGGPAYSRPEREFHFSPRAVHARKVDLGSAVRGVFSFDLQRAPDADPSQRGTVFTLTGEGKDAKPFYLQVTWEEYEGRPMIHLRGPRFHMEGLGLWGDQILLDRPVKPGQWIHVVMIWDDAVKKYELFVDGRKQDVTAFHLHPHSQSRVIDPRIGANEAAHQVGLPPAFQSGNFSEILNDLDVVHFGLHTEPGRPGEGWTPLSNAVLTNFTIRVDEVPSGPGPSRIASVTDDTFKVPGISGKLVAGDKISVEIFAAPGGKASFDMGKAKGIPMEEVPPRLAAPEIPAVDNGTYRGSYTIRPGDDFENGQIVGHFVSADNVATEPVIAASKWTIETKPRVTFSIDRKDLPADSSTKARIKLVAKDANGNPLNGRRLKLTLATTDQYTGTVGAGDFGKQVGGAVETRWRGETDAWGEVEFDYTAGFAAKTVILTAKDLDSGGVSVDYVTAYKEASIDIALTKVISRAAMRRSIQYVLKVEASRTELTADGRSRSVIRATLLDPNGTTVPGDPVAFTLSSPNGTLRTIQGTTDSSGVATAEYIAGKKIGIVVITATATLRNAQGQVSIILLADAPAKIRLAAKPDSLPADGMSRADIQVKVTDINDNPNRDTKVEFKVAKGGGKLDHPDRITDRFGDAANRYTAGTEAGVATILATVRSTVPTEAELAKARNVLFVPFNPDSEDIRVEKWLKKKGDPFVKDEPLVEYTVGRQKAVNVLTAPYDGTMREILVEHWDSAEVGQTLAVLEPVKK